MNQAPIQRSELRKRQTARQPLAKVWPRHTEGERYILAASNAGADRHPAWYLNLVADPDVTVQTGARTFAARARTATVEEKSRLWELIVARMPSYQGYQEATSRDIPVVIIDVKDDD